MSPPFPEGSPALHHQAHQALNSAEYLILEIVYSEYFGPISQWQKNTCTIGCEQCREDILITYDTMILCQCVCFFGSVYVNGRVRSQAIKLQASFFIYFILAWPQLAASSKMCRILSCG